LLTASTIRTPGAAGGKGVLRSFSAVIKRIVWQLLHSAVLVASS